MPVRMRRQLQVISRIPIRRHIRDHRFPGVVLLAASRRKVQLPDIHQPGRRMNRIPRLNRSALLLAVVHDRDLRMQRVHQRGRTADVLPVVAHDINIRLAHLILRAHQVLFLVPRQIAQIHHPELAQYDHASHGPRVLGRVHILRLEIGTEPIRLARPRQRLVDHIPGRRHDVPVQPFYRQLIARLHHDVIALRDLFHVIVVELLPGGRFLDRVAMVDEIPDRQPRGKRRHAAHVVGVIVRNQQVIDLRHAGRFRHRGDPVRVPAIEAWKSRIDQNALAGRREERASTVPLPHR